MRVDRNIRLLEAHAIFTNMRFVIPVILPFYRDQMGLSFDDFLLGEARFRGKGVGSAGFAKFAGQVLDTYPDVDYLVGYPHRDNRAFQQVLANAGYRRLADVADELMLPRPPDGDPNIVHIRPRAGFPDHRPG